MGRYPNGEGACVWREVFPNSINRDFPDPCKSGYVRLRNANAPSQTGRATTTRTVLSVKVGRKLGEKLALENGRKQRVT